MSGIKMLKFFSSSKFWLGFFISVTTECNKYCDNIFIKINYTYCRNVCMC